MHTKPMSESEGNFREEWKSVQLENPDWYCSKCKSADVWYKVWESSCGGYEDYKYWCKGCGHQWWVESADS